MMQNVTLRMDSELMRVVRHRAVDDRKSLSAWITDTLRTLVQKESGTEKVKNEALAILEKGVHLGGRAFRREEIYER
jgi:predicted transcriptional regulator